MDIVQARIDIMNWITGFVERPNPDLAGWPLCPYARRARLDSQFDIRPGRIDPYTDLSHAEIGDLMVVAYVYDPQDFDARTFTDQVRSVNLAFLTARDLIALPDHPADPEIVRGVTMNQGTWALVFLQPLSKLNHFARLISAQGYYDGWPEDYLQGLFEHREDPRS